MYANWGNARTHTHLSRKLNSLLIDVNLQSPQVALFPYGDRRCRQSCGFCLSLYFGLLLELLVIMIRGQVASGGDTG